MVPMTTEKFDVIVIGAGLGGLSAAGYLAKAGKSVLILEHHSVPGGYAHEFRRGKYRFEVSLHALDGAGPGGWAYPILRDLDILDQVEFNKLDPFYVARFPEHEISAHADPIAYEAELLSHFPHEKQGLRNLIDEMMEIYWQVRRFGADGPSGLRPPIEQIPSAYPKMLSAMSESWGDFMDRYIQDPKLKTVLSALWGYYGLPPSQLAAATYIFPWVSYHLFGAYYPEGGSMAMSRAFEHTLQKNGGEIRYRQTVNKIEMRSGRAVAVETEKGLRIEADVIISNANIPDTMLKFIGAQHLPEDYVSKIQCDKPAISNLVAYLGLERDLAAEGWPHHELFVMDSYDLDGEYQAVIDGRFEQTGIALTHYDHVDPTCAPEGGSVLSIFSLAPWDYADQWGTRGELNKYGQNPQYLELKEAAGEKLIDRAEALIPGLRDSIKYKEIATPLTNWRYSLNPSGSIYGSEQSVENTYTNRLGAKTPIPNVFLTGACAFAGGMSAAMLSGQETARFVRGYLDDEAVAGMVSIELPDSDEIETPLVGKNVAPQNGNGQLKGHTLQSVGSGRKITFGETGTTTVLLFHAQDTADQAAEVNQAVRNVHPDSSSVMIANVVDLRAVPKMFRNIANRTMSKIYRQNADNLPEGRNPEDYVLILPDWDGSIMQEAGMHNVNQAVGIVVLDAAGNMIWVDQGDASVPELLSRLANTL